LTREYLDLIAGRVGQNLVQVMIQPVVIIVMAPAIGVSFGGGVPGIAVLLLAGGCSGRRSAPSKTRSHSSPAGRSR